MRVVIPIRYLNPEARIACRYAYATGSRHAEAKTTTSKRRLSSGVIGAFRATHARAAAPLAAAALFARAPNLRDVSPRRRITLFDASRVARRVAYRPRTLGEVGAAPSASAGSTRRAAFSRIRARRDSAASSAARFTAANAANTADDAPTTRAATDANAPRIFATIGVSVASARRFHPLAAPSLVGCLRAYTALSRRLAKRATRRRTGRAARSSVDSTRAASRAISSNKRRNDRTTAGRGSTAEMTRVAASLHATVTRRVHRRASSRSWRVTDLVPYRD